MTPEAERMSAELADQLAASDREAMDDVLREELERGDRRTFVADTTQVPARFHHLSAMSLSAAHARVALQYPNDRDTLALRLGAGVHAMTFGDKPTIVYPAQRRKGAKNPSRWDLFAKEHADKVILSTAEAKKAQHISAALLAHEHAAPLLFGEGVHREHTILWRQQGRARRSTPDVFRAGDFVAELKTTRCAAPFRFVPDAIRRGYHAQIADQCNAIEAMTGERPRHAFIVAVETVSPYAITVFELTARLLEDGERLCRAWLDRLLLCEATGQWPAYSLAIETMDVLDVGLATMLDVGGESEAGDEPANDDIPF